jgi:hypothetical protein
MGGPPSACCPSLQPFAHFEWTQKPIRAVFSHPLSKMGDTFYSHSVQKDTTSRGRRLLQTLLKAQSDHGHQPGRNDATLRCRSSSRLLPTRKSPNSKIEETETARFTIGANDATLNITSYDAKAGPLGLMPDERLVATVPIMEYDMWKKAEEELRLEPRKRDILENYDRILEAHFESKLEPLGSLARQEQFLGFLNSELKRLVATDSNTRLSRCSNKAKRLFKSALMAIFTAKDIIVPATRMCLPASVACTGMVVLLSVSLPPTNMARC